MELYARVRRAVVVDKMSEREAAKEFGLARETVRKMLRYAVPPGYRRQQPVRRPKLDAWVGVIDQILEDDKAHRKKQRHTASGSSSGCAMNTAMRANAAYRWFPGSPTTEPLQVAILGCSTACFRPL